MQPTVADSGAAATSKPAPSTTSEGTAEVLPCAALAAGVLEDFVGRWGVTLQWVADEAPIPGSYWGESEAGLIGDALHVRLDTPVHSALHEFCHWICMDALRRAGLHTDAGGEDIEEAGVCYLQGLLADQLPGYSSARLFTDMDAWGYHFRLGSARAWFEQDAEDAQRWLLQQSLIDADGRPHGIRRL